MSKSINYTEQELKDLLKKNPKLQITRDSSLANKISFDKGKNPTSKIDLGIIKVSKKTSGSITVSQINKQNKESAYECSVSDEHFSILFKGARLLTINEILAKLQVKRSKFEVFSYKKNWHTLISKILYEQKILNKNMPFFDCPVEITVFRQAPRLVDKDAVSIMFKFIIDALKRNKENPYGIISEDNPQIVNNIIAQSEKGEYYVGIRIKKTLINKSVFLPNDILLTD